MKAKQLSITGRALLVPSITASLPLYTMRTTKIPGDNQERDICNCKFIWGTIETMKKTHLVSWKKIHKAKEVGGQGLRIISEVNITVMAKMGWKIMVDPISS